MACQRIERRAFVVAGAVAAGSLLTGCLSARQSLDIAAVVLQRKLVLPSAPLFNWETTVHSAWTRGGDGFQLAFDLDTGQEADARWIDLEHVWTGDVSALLKSLNMPLSILDPNVAQWFLNDSGSLGAFPISAGQLQFYVNRELLSNLGLAPPKEWTWATFVQAAEAGVSTHQHAGQVVGWGWGEVNTWAAFVHGLGAAVLSPSGQFNWTGVAAATKLLVEVARSAQWLPHGLFVPYQGTPEESPLWDFLLHGFSNKFATTLFGVMPPWTGRYRDLLPPNPMYVLPAKCQVGGLCSLEPVAFPVFPQSVGIPVFGWGLRASRNGMSAVLLGKFLEWLYQPVQQQSLALSGFMPMISDHATQEYWRRARTETDPIFDPTRGFDARKEVRSLNLPQLELAFSKTFRGADVDAAMEAVRTAAPVVPG